MLIGSGGNNWVEQLFSLLAIFCTVGCFANFLSAISKKKYNNYYKLKL